MRLQTLFLLALPMAVVSCADPAPLYVDQATISASSNPASPSAGYFTVHGGPESVELRAIHADTAQRIEMHDSVMEHGMMTMKPMDSIAIPAKSTVSFAPGGKHVMIYGLNPGAVKMGKTNLTFIFSNGDRLIVEARIQKQGAQAAMPADMGNMSAHNMHEGH